jgi:hypothetical protein
MLFQLLHAAQLSGKELQPAATAASIDFRTRGQTSFTYEEHPNHIQRKLAESLITWSLGSLRQTPSGKGSCEGPISVLSSNTAVL